MGGESAESQDTCSGESGESRTRSASETSRTTGADVLQRITEENSEKTATDDRIPDPAGGPTTAKQCERTFGVEIEKPAQAAQLQRLAETNGTETVREWADEGMPVEAMGTPSKMEAYRKRKDSPVPWDIEQRNAESRRRNTSTVQRIQQESPDGETQVPDSVREVISSPGQSLDPSIQRTMEDRMGEDFGDVQVHAGPKAAQAADDINARAFTVGNHVAFNRGEYEPSSPEGQHVIAHELAHVRQQTGGAVSMLPQDDVDLEIDPDPQLEREAEETAQRVMQGSEAGIQRMGETEVHVQRMFPGGAAPAAVHIPVVDEFNSLDRDSVIRVRDALDQIAGERDLDAEIEPGGENLDDLLHHQGIGLGMFGPRRNRIVAPPTLGRQMSRFVSMIAGEIGDEANRRTQAVEQNRGGVQARRDLMQGVIGRTATREWEARETEDQRNRDWSESYRNSLGVRWRRYGHWFRGLGPYLHQDAEGLQQWRNERYDRQTETRDALVDRQRRTFQYLNARDQTASWRRIRERAEIEHERASNNLRDIEPKAQQARQAQDQANQYRRAIVDTADPREKLRGLEPEQHQHDITGGVQQDAQRIPGRSLSESRAWYQKVFNAETGKGVLSYVSNLASATLDLVPFIRSGSGKKALTKRIAATLIAGIGMERTAGFPECPDCGHTNDAFLDSGLIGAAAGMLASQGTDDADKGFAIEAAATSGIPLVTSWIESVVEQGRQPGGTHGPFHITCERCRSRFDGLNTAFWRVPEGIARLANTEGARNTYLPWVRSRGDGPVRHGAIGDNDEEQRRNRTGNEHFRQGTGILGSASGWAQVGTDLTHFGTLGKEGQRPYSPDGSIVAGAVGFGAGPALSKPIKCPRPACNGHINRYVLNTANLGRSGGIVSGLAAGDGEAVRGGRGIGALGGLTLGQMGANAYRTVTGRRGARNPIRAECELCRWQWNLAGESWNALYDKFDPSTMDENGLNYFHEWVIDSPANDEAAVNNLVGDGHLPNPLPNELREKLIDRQRL